MSMLKYCLAIAAGAAVGAGICYIYAKENLEKKYYEMFEAERSKWNNNTIKNTDDISNEDETIKIVPNKLTEQVEEAKQAIFNSFVNETELHQPTTFVRYDKAGVDQDPVETESPSEEDYREPYVIEEEESDEDTRFEKKQLLYFEEDGVLMDPDTEDNLIDIEDDIVGQEWRIMMEDHGAEIVYVRNPKEERDYIIKKEYGLSANYLP